MNITNANNPPESHFTLPGTSGVDASITDAQTYTPVSSVNMYQYMDDSFYGSGGFRTGNYLVPHTREMFYKNRKELAAYRNFMRPIIRSLIDPVFEEEALRTIDGVTVDDTSVHPFALFLDDVDNDGTEMDEFTQETVMQARLHGVAFVVMDNYPAQDQPMTMQEANELRIMPYVYRRSAQDVETWTVNAYGSLMTITFKEMPEIVNGKEQDRWRMWTDMYSVLLGKDNSGKFVEVQPKQYHNLGCLPVIALYAQKPRCKHNILVDPPMYDIARLCGVLYNKDAEIRDQERAQAFSNFYMQGDPNGATTIGPHNVIFVPMEATIAPGFASPDSSILAGLVTNAEKLQQSIAQQAEQQGVIGVKSAESGVAAEWHFWSVESQLQKTSHMAEQLEDEIADLFMAWTGTDFEYDAEYPEEFQPGDQKAIIDRYKTILDLKPVEGLSKAIWRKITRMTLTDEDSETVQAIINEIDEETTEPVQPDTVTTMPGATGMQGMPEDMGSPDGIMPNEEI